VIIGCHSKGSQFSPWADLCADFLFTDLTLYFYNEPILSCRPMQLTIVLVITISVLVTEFPVLLPSPYS